MSDKVMERFNDAVFFGSPQGADAARTANDKTQYEAQMLKFSPYNHAIKASQKRVISLWHSTVDHIELDCDSDFSGTAILASVFTLAAKVQYYVVFITDNLNIVESWRAEPTAIPLSQTESIECDLLKLLKARGIELQSIFVENPQYSNLLKLLPLDHEQDERTQLNIYDTDSEPGSSASELDEDELAALKNLYIFF